MFSVEIIKRANERKGQNVLNKRVIKQLKNRWINVKRSELPHQMESQMSFLSDGLGVKITFEGVLNDRFGVLLRMDYLHCFIVYLDRTVSVPRSLEVSYHLLSFVHIQVRYDLSHHDMKSAIISLVLFTFMSGTTSHTTIGSHRGMHRDQLVFPEGEKVKHCDQQT